MGGNDEAAEGGNEEGEGSNDDDDEGRNAEESGNNAEQGIQRRGEDGGNDNGLGDSPRSCSPTQREGGVHDKEEEDGVRPNGTRRGR